MFDRLDHLNSIDRRSEQPFSSLRDAASLLIVDDRVSPFKVLMGQRHPDVQFMPQMFVFPGGAVREDDLLVTSEHRLRETTTTLLQLGGGAKKSDVAAAALAVTALRETFEETGYFLPTAVRDIEVKLHPYFGVDLGVFFQNIVFLARAITPPGRKKRFDTRFFIAPKSQFISSQNTDIDDGVFRESELIDVKWVSFIEALSLPLHVVTRVILEDLNDYIRNANGYSQPSICPLYHFEDDRFQMRALAMHSSS